MIPISFLLLRIGNESDCAFMKALYEQYHHFMLRMARTLTKSEQDAEDVVSEAILSLIPKITQLRQFDCNVLEAYIISTVRNAARMLYRKETARHEAANEDALLFASDEDDNVDSHILQECTIQELTDAIRQLPEIDQIILSMKYLGKESDRRIGETMQMQEGSVRSRLSRARKKLYALLGGASYER